MPGTRKSLSLPVSPPSWDDRRWECFADPPSSSSMEDQGFTCTNNSHSREPPTNQTQPIHHLEAPHSVRQCCAGERTNCREVWMGMPGWSRDSSEDRRLCGPVPRPAPGPHIQNTSIKYQRRDPVESKEEGQPGLVAKHNLPATMPKPSPTEPPGSSSSAGNSAGSSTQTSTVCKHCTPSSWRVTLPTESDGHCKHGRTMPCIDAPHTIQVSVAEALRA